MAKTGFYPTASTPLTGSELLTAVQDNNTVKLPIASIWANTVTGVTAVGSTGLTFTTSAAEGDITLTATLDTDLQAWSAIAPSSKQDTDATLTALAGQNWAANSLPVGSGADTVAQVTFAANTFPARSSAGNLVAKPITDFALTILDDADAATARTTLGLASGTYTPTITGTVNVSSSSPLQLQYLRVGNVVTVSGNCTITATAAGDTQFRMSLPIASNFTATGNLGGAGVDRSGTYPAVGISAVIATDDALFQFTASGAGARAVQFSFTYQVI
ncbi:hypothetical protein ABIE51_001464 [Lysobacter sp. OAE881]|uniref:hypothetical protein n=1 Tax=Lysobacter sp. OAE881 TaxID=2663813 RepID=UPI0017895310